MDVEDALQMLAGASDGFTQGEWCYAANALGQEVYRLRAENEQLREAIVRIYRTQVYEDGLMERGISVAMVGAIREAAELAQHGVPLPPEGACRHDFGMLGICVICGSGETTDAPSPCEKFEPLHPGLLGGDCANCRLPAGFHNPERGVQ